MSATTPLPKCRYCGKRLPRYHGDPNRRGKGGQGLFCSLICGYRWAVYLIQKADSRDA